MTEEELVDHKFEISIDDIGARLLLTLGPTDISPEDIIKLKERAFIEDGEEIIRLEDKIEELENYIEALEKRLAKIVIKKDEG